MWPRSSYDCLVWSQDKHLTLADVAALCMGCGVRMGGKAAHCMFGDGRCQAVGVAGACARDWCVRTLGAETKLGCKVDRATIQCTVAGCLL